jgi:hypothetical protein
MSDLLLQYSWEIWAVVSQHNSTMALFQMNCLRRVCGISLRNYVLSVVVLNRCSTLPVESLLQGTSLRWLGHDFRRPNNRLPKKLLFGEVKGLCPHGLPSYTSLILHYMIEIVKLVAPIGMHKTDCSGETRLVLAHHELESI